MRKLTIFLRREIVQREGEEGEYLYMLRGSSWIKTVNGGANDGDRLANGSVFSFEK
jgi:hypothetical protein